jgi:hypothetical protein
MFGRCRGTHLLQPEDELIPTLFGEVLLGEELLPALVLLGGRVTLLLGDALVEGILLRRG